MLDEHPVIRWIGVGLTVIAVGAMVFSVMFSFNHTRAEIDKIAIQVEENSVRQSNWKAEEDNQYDENYRQFVEESLANMSEDIKKIRSGVAELRIENAYMRGFSDGTSMRIASGGG